MTIKFQTPDAYHTYVNTDNTALFLIANWGGPHNIIYKMDPDIHQISYSVPEAKTEAKKWLDDNVISMEEFLTLMIYLNSLPMVEKQEPITLNYIMPAGFKRNPYKLSV